MALGRTICVGVDSLPELFKLTDCGRCLTYWAVDKGLGRVIDDLSA